MTVLLKTSEVAAQLRCSLANVYALISSGALISIATGARGSGIRVSQDDLDAFIESRRERSRSFLSPAPAKARRTRRVRGEWF